MCSQERAISDTIAALGDAGATRKREVGKVGGGAASLRIADDPLKSIWRRVAGGVSDLAVDPPEI